MAWRVLSTVCSLLWLLPPTSVAQPPAPAAPPALLTAPAPTVASDVQLWTLPDSQCQSACTKVSDVTLNWCSVQVSYSSFCDITGSLDIVTLEQTAINAFIAMEQSLTNPPTDDCKKAMHTWMCWQLFPECAGRTAYLLPICRLSCEALVAQCSIGWLDCSAEVEEVRGTAPPWWYDPSGAYIRGVKPASAAAAANFSRGLVVGVDGVNGQGPVYGEKPSCTGAAVAGASPHAGMWMLVAATTLALATRVEHTLG